MRQPRRSGAEIGHVGPMMRCAALRHRAGSRAACRRTATAPSARRAATAAIRCDRDRAMIAPRSAADGGRPPRHAPPRRPALVARRPRRRRARHRRCRRVAVGDRRSFAPAVAALPRPRPELPRQVDGSSSRHATRARRRAAARRDAGRRGRDRQPVGRRRRRCRRSRLTLQRRRRRGLLLAGRADRPRDSPPARTIALPQRARGAAGRRRRSRAQSCRRAGTASSRSR